VARGTGVFLENIDRWREAFEIGDDEG